MDITGEPRARQRELAAQLRVDGATQADIAAAVGVTQQCVAKWLRTDSENNTTGCNAFDARISLPPTEHDAIG